MWLNMDEIFLGLWYSEGGILRKNIGVSFIKKKDFE